MVILLSLQIGAFGGMPVSVSNAEILSYKLSIAVLIVAVVDALWGI